MRYFPDKPLPYSVYVWSGFFHDALQGLWVLAAFVLTFGGLRERLRRVLIVYAWPACTPVTPFSASDGDRVGAMIALGLGVALLIAVVSHSWANRTRSIRPSHSDC